MDKSDIGDLNLFIKSPSLRRFYAERKARAQEEVNQFVREQNLMEAYAALKRMDDIDKQFKVAEQKITELQKGA